MAEVDWSAFADGDPARPGVIVAVASGGAVIDWRSFGAVAPGAAMLDLETPSYVASLAKQFTAACVALLVLDQRLTVTDSVVQWLPELATTLGTVRVEHLLAHTSGLPASSDLDRAAGFGVAHPTSTAERLAVLRDVELEHEPGTIYRYSNHGYVLLAEIVSRASGVAFGELAAERLFSPLGMTNTGYLDVTEAPIAPGWAGGTRRVDIAFTCCGDGGLVSTVADLARWDGWLPTAPFAALMLGDRPVTPDGTRAHDAWGISIRSHRGERIESHGGAIDGYLAKLVRFPRLDTSFIALANSDQLGVTEFDARLARLADSRLADALDLTQPSWTETITTPASHPRRSATGDRVH